MTQEVMKFKVYSAESCIIAPSLIEVELFTVV